MLRNRMANAVILTLFTGVVGFTAYAVLAQEQHRSEPADATQARSVGPSAGESSARTPETTVPQRLGPDHHITFKADEIAWREGPGSLESGAKMAVLEGDPSKPEVFTLRLKLPDGYRIAPHWHPNYERVTVLSGTFRLGHGEQFDPDSAEKLEPGSYTTMPPGMRHFAVASEETVIQLTSVGPWKIHYVNPDDDPRNR